MVKGAYYNEFDPKAAAWIRELIKNGLVADGEVDERDLWDVPAADLRGFTQVHLCAGIAVWSYALRRAGWDDSRPVWTSSFPCQPFSAAGKGTGFADERHLWPAGFHLIDQCRPTVVFGEQVASKDAEPWLDLVQADLEGVGYALGAIAFPSASIGAPHIRDRTYWVADAASGGRQQQPDARPSGVLRSSAVAEERVQQSGTNGSGFSRLANNNTGLEGWREPGRERTAERLAGAGSLADGVDDAADPRHDSTRQYDGGSSPLTARSVEHGGPSRMGDAGRERNELGGGSGDVGRSPEDQQGEARQRQRSRDAAPDSSANSGANPVNGRWRDSDWLFCRDGKWRPVEPGTFPLAHGAPARVGRLRGYGNAINAEAAVAWIESYLEAIGERPYAHSGKIEEAAAVR